MPPGDDRDKLKRHTPPGGVASQLAKPLPRGRSHADVEDDDEKTPVGAPPEERRARAGDIDAAKAELKSIFEEHASDDIRQLGEIKAALAATGTDIRGLREGQREHSNSLTSLQVATAKQDVTMAQQNIDLATLIDKADLDEKAKRELEHEKAKLELQLQLERQKLELRDGADQKKQVRGFKWWLVRAAGGLAFAIATTLITLLLEHGTGC